MKKSVFIYILTVVLGVLLLMPVCSQAEQAAFTVLVYMTGSNLETDNGAATRDLNEMAAHLPGDGSVRLVVMAGGSNAWQSGIDSSETAIYEVRGGALEKLQGGELKNMGASETLAEFLAYGYAACPAQQYGLILWDHGAGPMMGVCFDEIFKTDGSMDSLTLDELDAALKNSPFSTEKLSFIGFDACLMASMETACAVAPYAHYMVASQDTEPASGWPYAFLPALSSAQNGCDAGKSIVEAYYAAEGDSFSTVTLSCIDLMKIPALSREMDALFAPLSHDVNEQSYASFTALRTDTKGLGCASSYEYDLVDLKDLLEVYEAGGTADCAALLQLLDEAIVISRSNTDFINGLSVYYPCYNKEQYLKDVTAAQDTLAFSAGYQAFIAGVSRIWLGDSLADWQAEKPVTVAEDEGVTRLFMQLTQEQAAQFSSAQMYIMELVHGGGYRKLYTTDDVTLTEGSFLQADYDGTALFVVDEQGELITTSLSYSVNTSGDMVLFGVLSGVQDGRALSKAVRLICRQEKDGSVRLIETVEISDDPLLEGKKNVDLSAWDGISLVSTLGMPAYDEQGRMQPLSEWEQSDLLAINKLLLHEKPWHFAFAPVHDSGERYAILAVTDAQQHTIYSDLMPINNPVMRRLPVTPQALWRQDEFTVSLHSAQQMTGVDPMVRVVLQVENHSEDELIFTVGDIWADRVWLGRFPLGSSYRVKAHDENLISVELKETMLRDTYITGFSQVDITLTCGLDYLNTLFENTLTMSVAADMSSDIGELPERYVLAQAEWDGLSIELSDIRVEDGDVYVMARWQNMTDAPVVAGSMNGYVNDTRVNGNLTSSLSRIVLMPGGVRYCEGKLRTGAHEWPSGRNHVQDTILEQLGITRITDIAFDLHHDDWSQKTCVRFHLSRPLEVAHEKPASYDTWPVLYDRDGIRVLLIDVSGDPNSAYVPYAVYASLLVENETDEAIVVGWQWEGPMVNGEGGYGTGSAISVPANTNVSEQTSVFRLDWQPVSHFDSLQAALEVIFADGTKKSAPVSVTVKEAPIMQQTRWIYDGDMLDVKTE